MTKFHINRLTLVAVIAFITCCCIAEAQAAPQKLGTYVGPGAIDGRLVGPGPTPGSERLYLAYMYVDNTVDLVSVNLSTGQWRLFKNPSPSEYGAVMVLGSDGDIYLGTRPHAHIYQLNPRTGVYKDLGQPAPGEAYIWQLAVGSDGNIYGCTYPSAKLVRYNPSSGRLTDLGRMDPKQQYALSIAASANGFVYVGIGTEQAHLVAYQIATGKHRDILPQPSGRDDGKTGGEGHTAMVHKGGNGKIYATVGNRDFLVKGWTAQEIPESEVRPAGSTMLLSGGRRISIDGNQLVIHGPGHSVKKVRYTYPGREGNIFRIAAGPDGRIFGSSILPFHLFALNPHTGRLHDIGALGHGEAYSLLSFEGRLFLGVYGGLNKAVLMTYNPAHRFDPTAASDPNPILKTYPGSDIGWRPKAMIVGPGGKLYIGSVAGYGSVDGPLTVFDPRTNHVTKFTNVVPGESIVTLAFTDGLIVGGTSIYGGGGSHPTQSEASLVVWNPERNRKIYQMTPVPGATSITDLLALSPGKVIGVATGIKSGVPGAAADRSVLFVEDVRSRRVEYTIPFNLQGAIFNSAAFGPDHAIWGLVRDGIFRFNPQSRQLKLFAKTPKPVTAGFALLKGDVYYASGPSIYRYALPTGVERRTVSR